MFTTFKRFNDFLNKKETNVVKTTIQPVDGKFGLFHGSELIGTYARKRDAVRGATRRELHIV